MSFVKLSQKINPRNNTIYENTYNIVTYYRAQIGTIPQQTILQNNKYFGHEDIIEWFNTVE